MVEKFSSWEKDFVDFLSSESAPPPGRLSAQVGSQIATFLDPSPWHVFSKLCAIVFAVSLANLAVCPQFGLSYFRNYHLVHFFMSLGLGHIGCNLICGAFFIGTAIVVAVIFIKPEELRVLRKTGFLQISAISALALAMFIALGATVFLPIAVAWLIGAFTAGVLTIEVAHWLRIAAWRIA